MGVHAGVGLVHHGRPPQDAPRITVSGDPFALLEIVEALHSERAEALGEVLEILAARKDLAAFKIAANGIPALRVAPVMGGGRYVLVGLIYVDAAWWFTGTRADGVTAWLAPIGEPHRAAEVVALELTKEGA
jgi:hypothetical protein